MINIKLEIFLGNVSFVILFLMMVLYWVQAIFFIIPKFNLVISFTTLSANLSLLSLLILRWVNYNHFPLSNLYESLLFLSWSFTLIQLVLGTSMLKYKPHVDENVGKTDFTNINIILGTIISPITLFTNGFATFSLPKTMQKAQALVPALQSNWLMMHVTVMMLSYTALLCGSLLAITFLIVTWHQSKSSATTLEIVNNLPFTNTKSEISTQLVLSPEKQRQLPIATLAKTLDNLSYRVLGIGFPLLTIGILSGAVWANEAWGSYWSWDPKETWAFITWLIFAIYLHARIVKGWEGEKPAILASFGFFIVWICYLGVNLLGTGLHSYGWMK